MTAQFLEALSGRLFTDCFLRAGGARVDLWWLDRGAGVSVFLYGWVLPRDVRSGLTVTAAHTPVRDAVAIGTWSCAGPIDEVLALVQRLLEGQLVDTAAPNLPVGVFVPGPLTYQLPQRRMHAWATREWSASSPLADAPAYCISLIQPVKARLLDGVEHMAVEIIEVLGRLVGFNFSDDHAVRLGNLDAFAFPSADTAEHSAVDLAFRGKSLVITIARSAVSECVAAIVRCAEHAFGRVLSDRLREVAWSEVDEPIVFAMSDDGPWVTYVDIWTISAEQTSALWYSNVFIPLRSIATTSTAHGSGLPASGWLSAWGARTPEADAEARLRSLQQQEATLPAAGDPLWASADLRARQLATLLAPAPGVDRLVPGGFAALATEGRLGELLAMLAPWGTSNVLFIDPLFDDYGLSLIAKIGFTQVTYHVLTTGSATRAPTISRLAQIARAGVLPVELGVVEIASPAGAAIGCFLLMLNAGGNVLRGFQLSTSASMATRALPLLINEIGRSALPDVAELVRSFLRCDDKVAGPGARYAKIWPPEVQPGGDTSRAGSDVDLTQALARLTSITDDETWASAWEDVAELLARLPRDDERLVRFAPSIADQLACLLSDVPRLARLPRRNERLSPSSYFLHDALSSPAAMQYHVAWDLVSHWHDRSAWWAVRYALKVLLTAAPPAAIRVLDAWLDQLISRSDPATTTLMVCVAAALEQIIRNLRAPRNEAMAFERILLSSRHALIRGIAVGSAGRRIVNDLTCDVSEVLPMFSALEPSDHAIALSECVYHLRVHANRAGAESTRDQQVRVALFEALIRIWPHARPDLRDTAFRLEGPSAGSWSTSTTFDLLIPLVEKGDLTFHEVIRLWADELRARWTRILSGEHYFYLEADAALTQLVATLLSHADPAEHGFLNEILRIAADARRVLDRPFSRSTAYHSWARARDGLIWMRAFAQLLSAELRPIAQPLLAPVHIESGEQDTDPSNLYRFARDVDRRFTS